MSDYKLRDETVKDGLYDLVLTNGMIENIGRSNFKAEDIDPEESHTLIAQFLEKLIASSLSKFRGVEASEMQRKLFDQIVQVLVDQAGSDESIRMCIANPLKRLLVIHSDSEELISERPDTPLARTALLTGTRLDPSLGSQLRKEIASADRVDILCSFIKWSGLRILLDDLKELTSRNPVNGPRLRLITTSYMGATDPKAIEELIKLPNTEIRVSYDTKRTRLHAKAYIFHRDSGFGSAYIGSANMSHPALSEGLEWTTKISQYELPYVWSKIHGSFETYWEDEEFNVYTKGSPERLRQSIKQEKGGGYSSEASFVFDLQPWPFQQEILDVLAAERDVQNKYRHLVVAATGTGKTMIAAFDYLRVCRELGQNPKLLFVAHREEILKQALGSFRAVLKDQNFGDLLVNGSEPEQTDYLFCSIQSYNSKKMWDYPPTHFQYVVVDEFHHAAASSYLRLLNSINPLYLLGLTATPDRNDELDIMKWFDHKTSAEIRLPDAINRRLLCPFQYFGVSDSVDLNNLSWQRGGYKLDDLNRAYTGNDGRAFLIIDRIQSILIDVLEARGLAFCVSKLHAEYMAEFFNSHSIPSIALTADSPSQVRQTVQNKLRNREINFIFLVDLFNEGVDIPEIDTVLFLRPTESLTVYLQQLGRGLRRHKDKDLLTVIDFIGAQRKEFQFAKRFRALSAIPTLQINKEIEKGFPHLPSGCIIQLERVAQQRILENIRDSIRLTRLRIIDGLRELHRYQGRIPTIAEILEYLDINLNQLLKRGLLSRLLYDAGLIKTFCAPDEERLAKGLHRISHVDCSVLINQWINLLEQISLRQSECNIQVHQMLHVSIWGPDSLCWTCSNADEQLKLNSSMIIDLTKILEYRLQNSPSLKFGRIPEKSGPLTIHGQYTRDEILVGLGYWTINKRPELREGVLHISSSKVDAFFVTLQKTEEEYSPTTMYEDYLISHDTFHWQSQSKISPESETGKRYINHKNLGYTPMLFVRVSKKIDSGLSAPYFYLGPCEYESHSGSKPISIIWKLKCRVPARLYRQMATQSTG